MAKVTYDKDMRALAKSEGKHLIAIAVEGEYAKRDGFTFTSPATPEEAKRVWEFFNSIVLGRNEKKSKK